MISKAIKFTSLLLIIVFAILPFIFFNGDNGLVFGTLFDQSIFQKNDISAGTKVIVPLIGTLSFALLILLVIFFLYEVFLENKTFGLVVTMNIMLLISMIVFSIYLYGFILVDKTLNESNYLLVGGIKITSLIYNISLAGTMLALVFILFIYSNILWFPIVADKFRYKKKLGFSFKTSKKDIKREKESKQIDVQSSGIQSEVDDFESLQPGLERNEIQQRKAAASFGRVPIDEFEEAYGLDLKTQVLTNDDLNENIPTYRPEIPKVSKEEIEIPKKSNEELDQIFSTYENKLKEDKISAVAPKTYRPEPKQLEEGYIMPRNRRNIQNQESDDLIFIPPSNRSRVGGSSNDNVLSDFERIERLMKSKNKQIQFEPNKVEAPKPVIEPKPKKPKKEKTKLLDKQKTFEVPTFDFAEVEDPLKEVVTHTINIDTEETEKVITPKPNPTEYKEDTYEEDTDEKIFNQLITQPKIVINEDIDTYDEDTDEKIFNQTLNEGNFIEVKEEKKSNVTSTIDWDLD